MTAPQDVRIVDFRPGRPVEGVYAVLRKQRRHDKNGDAYLVLELSDASGRIEGRLWKNAEWFDQNVSEGDHVRAVGRATLFRDTLQFDVRRIDPVEVEAGAGESFLPASRRDAADLAGEIDFMVDEIEHPELGALVRAVWQGDERERLLRSPATAADHHAYLGGLAEHTVSVAALCMAAADRHPLLDRNLLLAAALVHDIGRARELRSEGSLGVAGDAGLIGHVLLAHEMLLEARPGAREAAWWAPLLHAVASHHGSADRARTREAATLAACNALDARLSARDM